MLNIVIPMAGRGSRFHNIGVTTPKPLISVNNKFMIEGVIDNLRPKCEHRFIFICQKEHLKDYPLEEKLLSKSPDSLIMPINEYTEGAACTVMIAKDHINSSDELMIANSDQWIDFNINAYLSEISSKNLDGLIMTMKASNPKWSYVKLNDNNFVTEAVEKVVVSDEATVGIYNFTHGHDFCNAAEQMISLDKRVNGEFYVAPVYNELVNSDFKVGIYNIGEVGDGMYGLGTPEDLDNFNSSEISIKF